MSKNCNTYGVFAIGAFSAVPLICPLSPNALSKDIFEGLEEKERMCFSRFRKNMADVMISIAKSAIISFVSERSYASRHRKRSYKS